MKPVHNDKKSFLILALVTVVAGLGMVLWGQYNTARQIFDIGFNRYMIAERLVQDEAWAKSDGDNALYEKIINEGEKWRDNTPGQQSKYMAKTASKLYAKSEPQEIEYELYDNDSDTTVILLHAYNETVEDSYAYAPYWWSKGFNVLVPELRGHMQAGGTTTFGCYEQYDLLDLIMHEGLNRRGSKLIVHGKGVGAASALLLAGNAEYGDEASIDFIVSENTYSDLKELEVDQLKRQFSLGEFLLGDILDHIIQSKLGFDVEDISITAATASMKIPAVFISGAEDEFIGPEHTETVYQSAASEKEILLIPGAGYSMSYALSENAGKEYTRLLDKWIAKLGLLSDSNSMT